MKNKLLVSFLILGFVYTNNNSKIKYCGFDEVLHHKGSVENLYKDRSKQIFDVIKNLSNQINDREITYHIPVVFHIVYNNDNQNLPDSVIHSQIEVLNEDFRRLNEDASETREEFLPFAGDANIEFFLAQTDENGNPTTGITRTYTSESGFPYITLEDILTGNISLDRVKSSSTGGVDAWDTSKYLNIWVCNVEESFLGQVLGFAYPPFNIDDALDQIDLDIVPDWPLDGFPNDENLQGVVLHYPVVGTNNPFGNDDGIDNNDLGRACVHEVGHYLGLRHIWGDATLFEDGCSVDDGIEDTPNQSAASNFECNFNQNSCTGNYPDMVENYMDYSNDACMNMFTNNQIVVMRGVLEICRPGLIEGQEENECNDGDINSDDDINILDVVLLVNIIIGFDEPVSCADLNDDSIYNILDVVILINTILE